jgi:hypothetical protein
MPLPYGEKEGEQMCAEWLFLLSLTPTCRTGSLKYPHIFSKRYGQQIRKKNKKKIKSKLNTQGSSSGFMTIAAPRKTHLCAVVDKNCSSSCISLFFFKLKTLYS